MLVHSIFYWMEKFSRTAYPEQLNSTQLARVDSSRTPDKLETLCLIKAASMLDDPEETEALEVPPHIKEMIKFYSY